MNRDLEIPSTKPGGQTGAIRSPETLNVEVRVRETSERVAAASEREVEFLTSAQSWVVRSLVLGVVLLIAGVYVGLHLGRGWVPADDGTLGQSALRVFEGQLPHRDFAEIYTGGLSMIHALAFRAFGVSLMSLRICVFLFFLAWIPAVYYIALRFTSAPGAGLITLLAASWSFANYPAAMPSWYNLFFATFGAAALLRYLEARTRRWLFVAGICGGLSILIKVIGAYYIAGVLLFLAFLEQGEHDSDQTGERAAPYRAFSTSALLLFLTTLIYVFRARLGTGELYQFVLPPVALVGLILLSERKVRATGAGARFRALFGLVVPFVAGVLAPIVAFLAPYARSGAVGAFLSGVTSSAIARSIGLGVIRPVGVEKSIYALTLLGLLAAAMYLREFQGKAVAAGIGLALALMLYLSTQTIVSGVWFSAATVTPLLVLAGVALVFTSGRSGGLTKLQQQRVMLLISLAALCSLVQYPFAAPIYLSYSIPLTLLAAVAIVATAKKQPGTYVLAAVAAFYLLFGTFTLVPDYIYELTHKVGAMEELRLERSGGLHIEFATNVKELVHLLQQHSPNGLMYAGNDCPEFYFLAGLKNVTRDDGGAPADDILKAVQSDDLNLVVINDAPFFPGAVMRADVRAEVMKRFPHSTRVGIFEVFWKR